jgi:hypothetical protein
VRRLATICLLAVAAGCGGGDGERSDWAEGANAACREANAEAEEIPEPETPEQVIAAVQSFEGVARRLDARLRALRPAPDERERAARMVAAYARVIPILEGMADALRQGDRPTFQMLQRRAQELGSEGDRLANMLGANDCAYMATSE